jgi:hypothetical protein
MIKNGKKARRVIIKENFRFIIREKTKAFWLAYPKNSKNKDEAIFWETATAESGNIAAVTSKLISRGKINAETFAQICANQHGLKAVRIKTKKTGDCLEFVFKKIKKTARPL